MADGIIQEEGEPEQLFTNPQSPRTKAFLKICYNPYHLCNHRW